MILYIYLHKHYIYYDSYEHISTKNELQVVYKYDNEIKALVLVDFNSSIEYLGKIIAEQIERVPYFSQLNGLKAINMYKQGQDKIVPSYSLIKDYFQNGDTIFFDLTTQEYWLKCKFIITTSLNNYKTTVSLDIKVPISLKIKKLKMMLIQFSIIFFCENIEQINDFHFSINKVMIKLISNLKNNSYVNFYMDNRVFENCK